MTSRGSGRVEAFTLIEVLVVLAVASILMGLLSVAVHQSKVRAAQAGHISALRQIGQAAALYTESDGAFPWTVDGIRRAGRIPQELLASPLDPNPLGAANVYRGIPGGSGTPITMYQDSVLCAQEMVGVEAWRRIREEPGHGWAAIQATPDGLRRFGWSATPSHYYSDTFHRLNTDGSVTFRHVEFLPASPHASVGIDSRTWFMNKDRW